MKIGSIMSMLLAIAGVAGCAANPATPQTASTAPAPVHHHEQETLTGSRIPTKDGIVGRSVQIVDKVDYEDDSRQSAQVNRQN